MILRITISLVLVIHALAHGLGFAKAFGLAELPQLRMPISRSLGSVWLAAGLLVLAAAGAYAGDARGFWIIGAAAALLSQATVLSAWKDARFGTVANVFLAVLAVLGFLLHGPRSMAARYERDVATALRVTPSTGVLGERELAALPPAVQRYLRVSGAVGQPLVRDFRVRMRGRIRSSPRSAWLPFVSEQVNVVHPGARYFLMNAAMFGAPIVALHRYSEGVATMDVRLAGAIPLVHAAGPEMDQGETVTMFDDLCVFAPAALIDPAIRWGQAGPDTVRATFTHAGHTIGAALMFDPAGELVDVVSDDRFAASADGRSFTRMRWTTPIGHYRRFGTRRLAGSGAARWQGAEPGFTYLELDILDVEYNVLPR